MAPVDTPKLEFPKIAEDEEPTASLLKVLALLIQLEDDAQHSIEAAKVDVLKAK